MGLKWKVKRGAESDSARQAFWQVTSVGQRRRASAGGSDVNGICSYRCLQAPTYLLLVVRVPGYVTVMAVGIEVDSAQKVAANDWRRG